MNKAATVQLGVAVLVGTVLVYTVTAIVGAKDDEIKKYRGRYEYIQQRNVLKNRELIKATADYENLSAHTVNLELNVANWKDKAERLEAVSRSRKRTGRRAVARGKQRSGSRSLEQIKQAESGGNYNAKNPRSSASGAYQFLDTTWRSVTGLPGSARDYPKATQDEAARKLYAAQGSAPWAASAR